MGNGIVLDENYWVRDSSFLDRDQGKARPSDQLWGGFRRAKGSCRKYPSLRVLRAAKGRGGMGWDGVPPSVMAITVDLAEVLGGRRERPGPEEPCVGSEEWPSSDLHGLVI